VLPHAPRLDHRRGFQRWVPGLAERRGRTTTVQCSAVASRSSSWTACSSRLPPSYRAVTRIARGRPACAFSRTHAIGDGAIKLALDA
jgi:hypothetical protein